MLGVADIIYHIAVDIIGSGITNLHTLILLLYFGP